MVFATSFLDKVICRNSGFTNQTFIETKESVILPPSRGFPISTPQEWVQVQYWGHLSINTHTKHIDIKLPTNFSS